MTNNPKNHRFLSTFTKIRWFGECKGLVSGSEKWPTPWVFESEILQPFFFWDGEGGKEGACRFGFFWG